MKDFTRYLPLTVFLTPDTPVLSHWDVVKAGRTVPAGGVVCLGGVPQAHESEADVQVRHTLHIDSGVFLKTALQIQGRKVDRQRTERRRL